MSPIARALAVLAALHGVSTFAQERAQVASIGSTPRIGLALSGGGARGLAHIGVLKVLEEMRVPVHCVTGTSMGAVVGGTFAAGVSPEAMEKKVATTVWDEVFTDRPPRAEISTRRKIDDYKTLFAPEFGVKDGNLALPKGLLAGLSIETYFRELTAPAGTAADFASLPVPFRAVAADIVTGDAVVIQRGSLSQAMRASMSIPGAIAPVEIDGRLLVDGGIANNLPINEARKLCGDVIIAVNISTPPLKREELTSAMSVSLQLINLLGKQTVEEQIKSLGERDVLITPELGNISAGSFDRAADAIRIGEEAARAAASQLERYRVTQAQYAELRRHQLAEAKGLGMVDEIRFEGLERTNPEVLRSLVETKPGEPLEEKVIGADLRRIYGRGDFERVDYRIVEEPGRRVMVITPREKPWGNYLRIGAGFATDFHGNSPFNILAQYRRTWLNSLGGEWLVEGQIGRDPRLYTDFFQPINESGNFFVSPYGSIGRSFRGVYSGDVRVADYEAREQRLGFDIGTILGRTWGEARIGPVWRQIDARPEVGIEGLPRLKETVAGGAFRLIGDHLDNAWIPRSGHRVLFSAFATSDGMGSDRSYRRIEGAATYVQSFGPHTVNLMAAAGTDQGTGVPFYDAFTLGGPLLLSGYRIGQLTGERMAFGRLLYYNRAIPLPDILGSGVFVGGSLEVGRVKGRFDGLPDTTAKSASIFVAAETFLGPAYLGIGRGDGNRTQLYMLLGVP